MKHFNETFVPVAFVLVDYFLQMRHKGFVESFGKTISLRVIDGRVTPIYMVFLRELVDSSILEACTVVRDDSLGNSKSVDDVMEKKSCHIFGGRFFQDNCLEPFGEIICECKNVSVPLSGWWID
nr:hypothetical protein [Serratia marcescens]